MTEFIQIYTTTENKDDARMIAQRVVGKRLAACAQVVGPIFSTYWWEGAIEEAEEWLCIIKSRKDLFDKLEEAILGIHPYDVPEIIAVSIITGSQKYLQWLNKEVGTNQ
ncbi:MAG: divalent-cation tolerance protein CutA [Deltaproteobacteria bacterium]|nr:divalent-cation tolerance protein CutA [Deltaproteobacteria bacterium]